MHPGLESCGELLDRCEMTFLSSRLSKFSSFLLQDSRSVLLRLQRREGRKGQANLIGREVKIKNTHCLWNEKDDDDKAEHGEREQDPKEISPRDTSDSHVSRDDRPHSRSEEGS